MEKRDFADMVIYFCQKVSEMNISRKCRIELLGMITAIEIKHDELMHTTAHTTERTAKVDWINGEPFCPMCGDRLGWE